MLYQWEFRLYQRRFKPALQTSCGLWMIREGILLRLVDEAGNIGWGEIAPMPWFGSETIAQAMEFCRALPSTLTDDRLFAIPDALPSCQFGFESAWEAMREQAIDRTETHQRRNVQNQAALAPESAALQAQSSVIAVQDSTLQAQSSAIRPQSSVIAVKNSVLRPQSSVIEAQNSDFRPQSSVIEAKHLTIAVQNSDIAVQNSTLQPQHSDVAVQNSNVVAQNAILQPQHLKLPSLPHSPLPTPVRLSAVRLSAHVEAHVEAHSPLPQSALLPTGEAALPAWRSLWAKGFRTFKWKIGVQAIATELKLLHSLTQRLPASAKLRLDANGGLNLDDASQWLETCDAIAADPDLPVVIEYLEQPLPVSQFPAMQRLSQRYRTPIALDESVATLQQLQTCYKNGWRGIFVIKPAIVGSPCRLRQFCWEHPIDAVFSSVFETAIGRQAGLRLAATLGNPDRAMGYGTAHWFDEAETRDVEQLWQTL